MRYINHLYRGNESAMEVDEIAEEKRMWYRKSLELGNTEKFVS